MIDVAAHCGSGASDVSAGFVTDTKPDPEVARNGIAGAADREDCSCFGVSKDADQAGSFGGKFSGGFDGDWPVSLESGGFIAGAEQGEDRDSDEDGRVDAVAKAPT